MDDLFNNLNVVQILGVGLAGLALLLMILAFRLLNGIIKTENPNPAVIGLAKFYCVLTVCVLVIVGVFSLPLISKNKELAESNKKLETSTEIITTSVDVNKHLDKIKQSNDKAEIADQLQKIKVLTNKLPASSEFADPKVTEDVVKLKESVNQAFNAVNTNNDAQDMAEIKAGLVTVKANNAELFKTTKSSLPN